MFLPDRSLVGLLPVSQGHVSTDYEVTSAANGRTMILTRETRVIRRWPHGSFGAP